MIVKVSTNQTKRSKCVGYGCDEECRSYDRQQKNWMHLRKWAGLTAILLFAQRLSTKIELSAADEPLNVT